MATEKKTVDQRSFRRRQNVFSPVATSECAALCFPSSTSKEKTRDELALAERSERERQSKGLGNRGILSSRHLRFFSRAALSYLVTSIGKTSFPSSSPLTLIPPPRTRSLPLPTESPPTPCPSSSAPPPRTAKSSSSSSRRSRAPKPSGAASRLRRGPLEAVEAARGADRRRRRRGETADGAGHAGEVVKLRVHERESWDGARRRAAGEARAKKETEESSGLLEAAER